MNAESRHTLAGNAALTALYLDKAYVPLPNSTLNEKLSIATNQTITNNDRHALKAYVVGNRGHHFITGPDAIPISVLYEYDPGDACIYGLIPLVIRPIAEDLDVAQRANYCLRRIETISGVTYVAYYGRRVNTEAMVINHQMIDLRDSGAGTIPYQYRLQNLQPEHVPFLRPEDRVQRINSKVLRASSVMSLSMTTWESNEFRNACRIKYGSEDYAVISEIGQVMGVDRTVTGQGPGGASNVTYNEIIGAVVSSMTSVYYYMGQQNSRFLYTSDVGISEPMIRLKDEQDD